MQIETIGKFQLHLIALEIADTCWDPFVTIMKFDDSAQDFVCVLEKHHAGDPQASYEEAIEVAREAGTNYMHSDQSPDAVGSISH